MEHINGQKAKAVDPRPQWMQRLSVMLHVMAGPYVFYVYAWHFFSPLAKRFPGYHKFGWFYRHLTFWTFTLQMLQLTMATIADLFPKKVSWRWRCVVGSMACLVVCAGSTVTTMYYGIRTIDSRGMDPPETRVPWVNLSVHVWNSVIAWSDIFVSFPRFFSSFDQKCVVLYCIVYSTWLLTIKYIDGSFPYPFLNKLPPLIGWCATCLIGSGFMLTYFAVGRKLKRSWDHKWETKGKDVTS